MSDDIIVPLQHRQRYLVRFPAGLIARVMMPGRDTPTEVQIRELILDEPHGSNPSPFLQFVGEMYSYAQSSYRTHSENSATTEVE